MLRYDGKVPDNWHAIPHGEGLQHVTRGIPSMRGSHPSERGFFADDVNTVLVPRADEVIDRMREAVGARTDIELADKLKLGKSAPSNWRLRERVPIEACVEIARGRGISLDWLLFGLGKPARSANVERATDAAGIPAKHVVIQRLRGFDATDGNEELVLPELVLRQRIPTGDLGGIRWMVNPTDAMSPRLPQGRLLLVDTTLTRHEDIIGGETYVVRLSGRVNVRRIYIIGPNEYRLRGDDEHQERRDITGPDHKHLEVGGRVIDII